MIHRIFKKLNKNGLTFIEVLIVMSITGFTLVALLNLTARDILVERLNEEQDKANYIMTSQLQEFDTVVKQNPSCLSAMQSAYQTNNTNYIYYICKNLTPTSQFPQCNTNPTQTWHVYQAPSGWGPIQYSEATQDCAWSPGAGQTIQWWIDLQIVPDTNPNTKIAINSVIGWQGSNGVNQNNAIQEQYNY